MSHFGPRPLVEDGGVRSSVSTLLNAQVTCRLGRHLRLSGDLFNILDPKVDDIAYDYPSRLRSEPSPVSDVHFHPAEPRSVRLGATFVF